jgi:hypothetical protein
VHESPDDVVHVPPRAFAVPTVQMPFVFWSAMLHEPLEQTAPVQQISPGWPHDWQMFEPRQ